MHQRHFLAALKAKAGLAVIGSFLSSTLLVLSGSAVPAQAAAVPIQAETPCSGLVDNRSSDNWTSAEWKVCVDDSSGPHGQVTVYCWAGQVIGWNRSKCEVTGRYEIRKGSEVIKSGDFLFRVGSEGGTFSNIRFSCQGRGAYTFDTSDVQATLLNRSSNGVTYPRPNYQSVNIADATATRTMC